MTVTSRPKVALNLPDNDFSGDVPLVAVMRGPYVGSLHRGTFAVADVDGQLVLSAGRPDQSVFLRSAVKPFQAMPAVLSGAVELFGLTLEETAILCASHSGEPRHMAAVLSALGKAGLDESNLRCGIHPPIHERTAADLTRRGISPSPVCNNCSGAHTGMLLACVANGWPLDSYGDPDHPLQIQTRRILASFAGMRAEEIQFATDNCAVPTFRIPLGSAATAFARLGSGRKVADDLASAAETLTGAMTSAPEMVAGEARFDSDLMLAAEGQIVSKGGAEGFQGVGLRTSSLGIALKISDGNSRAVGPATMVILDALGAIAEDKIQSLADFRTTEVRNPLGDRVGEVKTVFLIEPPA